VFVIEELGRCCVWADFHSFKAFSQIEKLAKIFLIYQEIQNEAVAKLYMRKGYLIYEKMRKYFAIYEEAVSHIYDFAIAPF
jgi:hypothetical protein